MECQLNLNAVSELDKLLEIEEKWLYREGEIPDSEWAEEGIQIYRKLTRLQPENIQFQYCLAKLLLDYSTDLKMKHENYQKAKELLKESLYLQPENGILHYHLGYIYFLERSWLKSLTHLEAALLCNQLSQVQKMRALLASSVSHSHLSDKGRAEELYNKAKELDPDSQYVTEFQMTKMQFKKTENPVLVYRNHNDQEWVSIRGSHCLIDECEEATTILDLRKFSPITFTRGDHVVLLEPKEAELLKVLMTSVRAQSIDLLLKKIWPEKDNKGLVKKYISNLRRKLKTCFPEDDVISTITGEGYKWVAESPFIILTIPFQE